jgi:phage terminase large subunit
LRQNLDSIKSKARVLLAWIDEAENVSEAAWDKLIPTVRESDSEIWVTWNPELDGSPTDKRFRKSPPDGAKIIELNWQDNPWFPDVLRVEKDHLYAADPDRAVHVWGGGYKHNSVAQVLNGKTSVEEFDPLAGWDGPYQGVDWGFSQDPTTLVRCWIHDKTLYIEHEAYGIGVDIDKTPRLFDSVPMACDYISRADCARPETISFMQRHGYGKVVGVEKWSGSVEDGIAFLRSFMKIVIHPRCTHAIEEARLWSYKVDRLSGDGMRASWVNDDLNEAAKEGDAVLDASAPLLYSNDLSVPMPLHEADRLRAGTVCAADVVTRHRHGVKQPWRLVDINANPIGFMLDIQRLIVDPASDKRCRVLRESPINALIRAIPSRQRIELFDAGLAVEHLGH